MKLALPILAMCACAQSNPTDPAPEGVPPSLASSGGTLGPGDGGAQPNDTPVSIVWAKISNMETHVAADTAYVDDATLTFEVSRLVQPAAEALDVLPQSDERYGVGLIVVAKPGGSTEWENWLGADYHHVAVYLPQDTAPDGVLQAFLGGPAGKGFHVYDIDPLTDDKLQVWVKCVNALPHDGMTFDDRQVYSQCGSGNDRLVPSPTDLDTPLAIEAFDGVTLSDFNRLPHW